MFLQSVFLALFVAGLVLTVILITGQSPPITKLNLDKALPIECGFDDHIKGARSPFSLYFFIISVLFLVFDVETVILFPAPIIINFFSSSIYAFNVLIFLLILLVGLIHETRQGALK